ncbi:unnamed protein product [Penicillium discolor]
MTDTQIFEPEGRAIPFVDEGDGPVKLVLIQERGLAADVLGVVGHYLAEEAGFHVGTADEVTPSANAESLRATAPERASIKVVEGGDHLFPMTHPIETAVTRTPRPEWPRRSGSEVSGDLREHGEGHGALVVHARVEDLVVERGGSGLVEEQARARQLDDLIGGLRIGGHGDGETGRARVVLRLGGVDAQPGGRRVVLSTHEGRHDGGGVVGEGEHELSFPVGA